MSSTTTTASNKRARSEQSSACTECQRRKGKCIGGRPCTFCAKTGRKCIDQPQISRIPLTRKNMDELHDRCQRLQSLLQSINPSINVDEILGGSSPTPQRYGHDRKQSSGAESSGVATPEEDDGHDTDAGEEMNPCKFEWHEDPTESGLADGMAGLNVNSRDVGYLGRSSAAALLRHVHRLLKAHERATGNTGGGDFEYIFGSPLPSPRINTAEKRIFVQYNEDVLIDNYFRLHHATYPIVHEPIFRESVAKFRTSDKVTTTHWQTLYRMVLVTGAFVSGTDHNDPSASVDKDIYKRVNESFLSLDFFSYGTLEGVQALALMGQYLQKRDNPNTGYNCLGMAMRMALGLGLHRDVSEPKGPTLGMEIRRRIWWTLYIFDVGASITFGRPTIPSDKVFTKIPVNVNDFHLTDRNALLPPPCETVTVYSAMIAHAHLSVLMNRIHLNFFIHPRSLSSCRVPLSRELIAKFDEQITRWQSSLPAYFNDRNPEQWFAAPKAIIEWKALNMRMLMYKCFLDCLLYSPPNKPPNTTPSVPPNRQTHIALLPEVRKCLTFALSTLASIRKFTTNHRPLWHGVGWYATYYSFQAALVLVTAILSVPRDASVSVWKDGVLDALGCLRTIEPCCPNASRVAAVLRWCLMRIEGGEVQQPCVGVIEQPVEESRISGAEYRHQMEIEYNGMLNDPTQGLWNPDPANPGGFQFGQGGNLGSSPFFGQYEEMPGGLDMGMEFWGNELFEAGLGIGALPPQQGGPEMAGFQRAGYAV